MISLEKFVEISPYFLNSKKKVVPRGGKIGKDSWRNFKRDLMEETQSIGANSFLASSRDTWVG